MEESFPHIGQICPEIGISFLHFSHRSIPSFPHPTQNLGNKKSIISLHTLHFNHKKSALQRNFCFVETVGIEPTSEIEISQYLQA